VLTARLPPACAQPALPLPSGSAASSRRLLRLPVSASRAAHGMGRLAAAIVLGVARSGLAVAAASSGATPRTTMTSRRAEPDDDESGWISLGFLAHSLLSLRARLARLFGRHRRTPMPSPTKSRCRAG